MFCTCAAIRQDSVWCTLGFLVQNMVRRTLNFSVKIFHSDITFLIMSEWLQNMYHIGNHGL